MYLCSSKKILGIPVLIVIAILLSPHTLYSQNIDTNLTTVLVSDQGELVSINSTYLQRVTGLTYFDPDNTNPYESNTKENVSYEPVAGYYNLYPLLDPSIGKLSNPFKKAEKTTNVTTLGGRVNDIITEKPAMILLIVVTLVTSLIIYRKKR